MEEGRMLSARDKIRSIDDRPSRIVDIPEWGLKLEVRGLTVRQQADLADRRSGDPSASEVIGEILLATVFDPETGQAVFTREDLGWLMERSAVAIDRITTAAAELSGILPGQDEVLGKAFSRIPTGSSSSP